VKRRFYIILLLGLIFITDINTQASFTKLFIYAGDKTYLGCLTDNKYSTESVWNKYGTYGSEYSAKSIWNKYGTYGSPYSQYSPWNEYSNSAPVIVDQDWNFHGHFSINKYHKDRTRIEFCLWILDNYESIVENFDDVADLF